MLLMGAGAQKDLKEYTVEDVAKVNESVQHCSGFKVLSHFFFLVAQQGHRCMDYNRQHCD
jgi:hypothetical protein